MGFFDSHGRWIDNINMIASQMRYERRMKRFCRMIHRRRLTVAPDAMDRTLYPGDVESFGWIGRCDTLENVSEDQGIYEEINRPDVYGYYKTSHDGYHMTLAECAPRIGRNEWYDYDANVMYGPPVAVVTIDWSTEIGAYSKASGGEA